MTVIFSILYLVLESICTMEKMKLKIKNVFEHARNACKKWLFGIDVSSLFFDKIDVSSQSIKNNVSSFFHFFFSLKHDLLDFPINFLYYVKKSFFVNYPASI